MPALSRGRRFYALGLLTVVTLFSTIDRQIMNILVEPIRTEMRLSDSQMGLLTGVAFALINMVGAIPAARLADVWSRRKLVAIAVSFWSVMTILSGMANSFGMLFAARLGVGFGEAGGNAPTYAIVGDLFERRFRATAMGVVMLAPAIGMMIGLMWGGYAAQHYGWRTALIVAGIAGLAIGPLVFLTLPEVRKGHSDGAENGMDVGLSAVIRQLWETSTIALMLGATMLSIIFFTGLSVWFPAFLARSHGMAQADIGTALGLALGGGTFLGTIIGGPLIDRVGRHRMSYQLLIPAIGTPIAGCLALGALLLPLPYVFPLLAAQACVGALFGGGMIAVMLNLSPVSSRTTAVAIMTFVISGVAMGLGPQVAGILSDLLTPHLGREALRWALASTCVFILPATLLYILASRCYSNDLKIADARIARDLQ